MEEETLCGYCEKLFTPRMKTQKFCSRRCKEEFRKAGRMSKSTRQQMYENQIDNWTKSDEQFAKDYGAKKKRYRERLKIRSKFPGIISHSKEELINIKGQTTNCGLCGDVTDVWCADHDHKTGKFRDMICHSCNKGLGNFRDDVGRLEKAIKYLKKHLS